ncbi:hypothetical protein STEG23_016825, partial [Scotinomys teguina]
MVPGQRCQQLPEQGVGMDSGRPPASSNETGREEAAAEGQAGLELKVVYSRSHLSLARSIKVEFMSSDAQLW